MGREWTEDSAALIPRRYQNACWARTSVPSTNQLKLLACVAVSNCAMELPSVNVNSAADARWAAKAAKAATIAIVQRPRKAARFRDVQRMSPTSPVQTALLP